MGIFGKTPDTQPDREAVRPAPPARGASPAKGETREEVTTNCLVGPKTAVKGEISGHEDVVIRGRVEGTISVDKHLIVDTGGRVQATVRAAVIIISGELVGDCHARERVELRSSGRLRGDIHAPRIVIAEGAEFHGRSHMAAPGAVRQATVTQKAG